MIKKKSFELKNPMLWGGAIVSIGIVLTFLTKFVDFIRIPDALAATNKKVEEVENQVTDVKEYIKEQKIANDLMQKYVTKEEKVILSPNGKQFWNEKLKQWRPIGELDS